MKRFLLYLLKTYISSRLRTVPIQALRCEQKKVAMDEGWGGQTIDRFPPCGFYKMFHAGSEEEAVAAWKDWYFERFVKRRLYEVAKIDGGMRGGSLYRRIMARHQASGIDLKQDMSNADESLIRETIETRVLEEFELLKSIRLHGYSCAWDYISARKEENQYILIEGHHRVAAMEACGHQSVMIANSRPIDLRIAAKLGRKIIGDDGY